MVNPGLTIKLFDFQEQAVLKLLDLTAKQTSKQTVVMKAPTGSGKTIILIDYVDEYLTNVNNNTAFIWLCPGKGNLEEQSRDKMQKIAPHRTCLLYTSFKPFWQKLPASRLLYRGCFPEKGHPVYRHQQQRGQRKPLRQ